MYLKDPNTGLPSVSLTLMIASVVFLCAAGVAQMLGKVESVGPFTEMMYSFTALYFGRKFTVRGQAFGVETPADSNSAPKDPT